MSKAKAGVVHILILVLVVAAMAVAVLIFFNRQVFKPSNSPTGDQSPRPTTVSNTSQIGKESEFVKLLSSPNSRYSISLAGNETSCSYKIEDVSGQVTIPDALPNSVSCHENDFGEGWLADNLIALYDGGLAVEEPVGSIHILKFSDGNIDFYDYSADEETAAGVNKNFTKWLFVNSQYETNKTYRVKDENKNTISEFTITNNDRPVLYDEVNDGFLFISRVFETVDGQDYVSTSFDYYDNSTQEYKHLLKTDAMIVFGRGCNPEELIPTAQEIVLTSGCLTVDEKYFGEDNRIHIDL